MKNIIGSLLVGLGIFTANLVHAQTDYTPPMVGTFYLQSYGAIPAPFPYDPYGGSEPMVQLTNGAWLIEDTPEDFQALQEMNLSSRSFNSSGGMMSMDSPFDFGGGGGGSGDEPNFPQWSPPTNGLWLEMDGEYVQNWGYAYLTLHNPTNAGGVYEIFSKTNLLQGQWDIETDVWPDNTNAASLWIETASRPDSLYLWARDWTGIKSFGNQVVPEWWLWEKFSDAAISETNVDMNGLTLLYDYEHGLDPHEPNVIQFTPLMTNNYVNRTNATVQIALQSGQVFYQATLVNDTNFADALWQPYASSNITVNLGTTDGVYNVWVGLRGMIETQQVWDTEDITFHLDRVAPVVNITSPAGSTVIKPYLQLQGFADKPLASLSYDISNAFGLFTNQDAFVTDQSFDTNKFDFTTNFFQCYDVPLTNGVNHITLRVSDRAGNMTATNFNVTLDYTSATNPPTVNLIWPQDGMAVSGENITIRGTMSDETGTIQAQVVHGDGTTNVIDRLVERNNMFWIENVPLNGTNRIMLQATDAAGNVTTTNFTIMPGSLTLTIHGTPTGDALYQGFGSVNGTVSDPDAVVTVNGVVATVHDDLVGEDGLPYWEADNVPIVGQGTATFDVVAQAAGNPPVNTSLPVEKGAFVAIMDYHSGKTTKYNYANGDWVDETSTKSYHATYPPDGSAPFSSHESRTDDSDWSAGLNASWSLYIYDWTNRVADWAHYTDSNGTDDYMTNPSWGEGDAWGQISGVPDEDLSVMGAEGGPAPEFVHHYFADKVKHHWDDGQGNTQDASVGARTKVMLFTGGKAKSKRQNLFCIHAGAEAYGSPPQAAWMDTPSQAIDPTSLTVAGKHPDTNGNFYIVFPDNSAQDVTVIAPAKHYNAHTEAQKYLSYFEVFVQQPYPGTTYYDPTSVTGGHAFWGLETDAPDEAIQRLSPSLQYYVNASWGFYPHGAICGLPGQLQNDDGHGYSVERVFYIGFNDLISGLQFTRGIDDAPPIYCFAAYGYSCVGATTDAGRSVGIALPTWWNPLNWTPQNFGAAVVLKYPGPLVDDTPR